MSLLNVADRVFGVALTAGAAAGVTALELTGTGMSAFWADSSPAWYAYPTWFVALPLLVVELAGLVGIDLLKGSPPRPAVQAVLDSVKAQPDRWRVDQIGDGVYYAYFDGGANGTTGVTVSISAGRYRIFTRHSLSPLETTWSESVALARVFGEVYAARSGAAEKAHADQLARDLTDRLNSPKKS